MFPKEAQMTPTTPLIPDREWQAMLGWLPPGRRDRALVTALVFRATSGASLRDVSERFRIARSTLSDADAALQADMPRILTQLRLQPASASSFRRGGASWQRRRAISGNILDFKIREFADQLDERNVPRKSS
jgi:hypothetical protein